MHPGRPSLFCPSLTAGWSSPVARQAHNLKVLGSNPSPATNFGVPDASTSKAVWIPSTRLSSFCVRRDAEGGRRCFCASVDASRSVVDCGSPLPLSVLGGTRIGECHALAVGGASFQSGSFAAAVRIPIRWKFGWGTLKRLDVGCGSERGPLNGRSGLERLGDGAADPGCRRL